MRKIFSTDEIISAFTTNQVRAREAISYESMHRYERRGWIPKPTLGSYGKGKRGQTLWWPAGILFDLAMIRALRKAGYGTDEIDQIIKGEKK